MNLLNKFLCWAWGCTYKKVWVKLNVPGASFNNVSTLINKCKHCGRVKP